jgi:hypothetical protein
MFQDGHAAQKVLAELFAKRGAPAAKVKGYVIERMHLGRLIQPFQRVNERPSLNGLPYDRIEVHWPGGARQSFAGGPANRVVTLVQGR